MKTERSFAYILIVLFLTLLQGCATYPRSGPEALAGTWTNSLDTVWTMKSDGTFEVDLNHDGKRDAWGTYAVTGDTITIHGTGGKVPKGCQDDGIYKFSRDASGLHFGLVRDNCKERIKNVLLDWKSK